MAIVNLLPLELTQVTDNKSVNKDGVDSSKEKSDVFSGLMKQHQQPVKNGNNASKSGNSDPEQNQVIKNESADALPESDLLKEQYSEVENSDISDDLNIANKENIEGTQVSILTGVIEGNSTSNTESNSPIKLDTVTTKETAVIVDKVADIIDKTAVERILTDSDQLLLFISASDKTLAHNVSKEHEIESMGKIVDKISTTLVDNKTETIKKSAADIGLETAKIRSEINNTLVIAQSVSENSSDAEGLSEEKIQALLKKATSSEEASLVKARTKFSAPVNATETPINYNKIVEVSDNKNQLLVDNDPSIEDLLETEVKTNLTKDTANIASLQNVDTDITKSVSFIGNNESEEFLANVENISRVTHSQKSDAVEVKNDIQTTTNRKVINLEVADVDKKPLVDSLNNSSLPNEELLIEKVVQQTSSDKLPSEVNLNQAKQLNQLTSDNLAKNQKGNDEQRPSNQQFSSLENEKNNADELIAESELNEKNNVKNDVKPLIESLISRQVPSHTQPLSSELGQVEKNQSYENVVSTITTEVTQTQKHTAIQQAETISIMRKDFNDALKDKVMVMIHQKIRQIDIQLDPPEFGNMQVRVNLQGEQAAVSFIVQNQQAKEALDQNMDRLKGMLADSGVDVGEANVKQQSNKSSGGEQNQSSGSQKEEFDGGTDSEQQITMNSSNVYKASSTGVDYYA